MRPKQNIKLQTVNRENLQEKDLKRILGGIRKCKDYVCQCKEDSLSYSRRLLQTCSVCTFRSDD